MYVGTSQKTSSKNISSYHLFLYMFLFLPFLSFSLIFSLSAYVKKIFFILKLHLVAEYPEDLFQ